MSNSPLLVVACVIEREGRYLITQRLKESHLGHLWEFPGGKLEPGETLEECGVRECREEIGATVKPLRLLSTVEHDYPERSIRLHFFLCELVHGEPRAIECAALAWVGPEELGNYAFPEADRALIEKLRGGKKA